MKLYSSTQKLPITDEVGSTIVSLPMHANLSNSDVDRIIKFSNEFSNR
jgi:dTDP-4-amino-4,6-dideoxygalactose transaminase